MPPKKLMGTEITSAQGQETTRNVSARLIQSLKTAPGISRGGSRASASAEKTTTGV